MQRVDKPSPGPVGLVEGIAALGFVATFVVSVLLALSGDFRIERVATAVAVLVLGWTAAGLVFVFTSIAVNVATIAAALSKSSHE